MAEMLMEGFLDKPNPERDKYSDARCVICSYYDGKPDDAIKVIEQLLQFPFSLLLDPARKSMQGAPVLVGKTGEGKSSFISLLCALMELLETLKQIHVHVGPKGRMRCRELMEELEKLTEELEEEVWLSYSLLSTRGRIYIPPCLATMPPDDLFQDKATHLIAVGGAELLMCRATGSIRPDMVHCVLASRFRRNLYYMTQNRLLMLMLALVLYSMSNLRVLLRYHGPNILIVDLIPYSKQINGFVLQ